MISEEQLQAWEKHPIRMHLDSGTVTNDMVARQQALIAEVRRLREALEIAVKHMERESHGYDGCVSIAKQALKSDPLPEGDAK